MELSKTEKQALVCLRVRPMSRIDLKDALREPAYRIDWILHNLKKNKLITKQKRGLWKITRQGWKALNEEAE